MDQPQVDLIIRERDGRVRLRTQDDLISDDLSAAIEDARTKIKQAFIERDTPIRARLKMTDNA